MKTAIYAAFDDEVFLSGISDFALAHKFKVRTIASRRHIVGSGLGSGSIKDDDDDDEEEGNDVTDMVSLTIPIFGPSGECSSVYDASSDKTPNSLESWTGFKVMAKRYEKSDIWTLCEIRKVSIDKNTLKPLFDVKSYSSPSFDTTNVIPEDRIKRLFLRYLKLDLVDINTLQSMYYNQSVKLWKHNLFYSPEATDYLQLLNGFEKIGLYLGIDGVDENGRVTSLNLDFHGIEDACLESISMLSQLRRCSLAYNKITDIHEC
jgi:hypothetical protein